MKRLFAALALSALLLAPAAQAAPLVLDNAPLEAGPTLAEEGTVYVSLRAVTEALCPEARISWDSRRAAVELEGITLEAVPTEGSLSCNGVTLAAPGAARLEEGRVLVPVRLLAAALGWDVDWNAGAGQVELSRSGSEDLYWLSRIISAESRGECLEGKIAVGNVVLNRVKNGEFPDSIYGVIFDDRWGGQFEPVRNGTVYNAPTDESVLAARLCLAGASVVGESLYFLAPDLTSNHWIMDNRPYVTTIGVHWFYK